MADNLIAKTRKRMVGTYCPVRDLGKKKLLERGKSEPKMDSKFAKDEPNVEIRKGQIRGTNTFEIENVILCEKVYKGRIG